MFDIKIRLINMLGLITIIVLISLILDYAGIFRRKARLGLSVAIIGIGAGFTLVLSAVLPENHFYGTVFSQGATNQKLVAITFDDGPYPPYTEGILDILKEKNIKATFFVIGQNVAKHPQLVKRIFDEGHQIGNHTYTHKDLLKVDRKTIAEEIERTNKLIFDITGYMPEVIRLPHGFKDAVILEMMAERGLKVVEWSVASRDWLNPGIEAIVSRTLSKIKNDSIILLHDGDAVAAAASREQTVQATEKIVDQLLEDGYLLVTVAEILDNRLKMEGEAAK